MLLEVTTTMRPATDWGFLVPKNPARAQSFSPVVRARPCLLSGGIERALHRCWRWTPWGSGPVSAVAQF